MSQNSFQEKRQAFTKERRRQQLQEIISSRRKIHSIQWAQNQKQTFVNLLPTINQHTYEENRFLLSSYARSTNYSYDMLPIVGVVLEYLISHPLDPASWQIVTYLSYYQDLQIPQTQQFVGILLQKLNENPQLISELLLNISKLPKCSLLCCRLIDAQIIYLLGERIQSVENFYIQSCLENKSGEFKGKDNMELQIHNFLFTLSELFALQPLIEIYQMNKICEILNFQTNSNRFLKEIHTEATFKLIQKATQDLSHQSPVIQLLVQRFQEKLNCEFFLYEEESIYFLNCCVKNKIFLTERLIKNLFHSIKSKDTKNKASALKVLQKILTSGKEVEKMEIQPNKFHSLQPFIQNKVSISFEDFNSMFTTSKPEPQNSVSESQLQSRSIVYSILFTENYESELKTLFEIFQTSNQRIKEEMALFVEIIVKCLIEEIDYYEPKKLKNSYMERLTPESMRQFLYQTVTQDETYYFLGECLKSSSASLIQTGLRIIKDLVLYFDEAGQKNEEDNSEVNLAFFVKHLENSSIDSTLEHLMSSENYSVRDLTEDILSLIDQELY